MLAAVAIVFVCYMTTSYALLSDVHVMVNGLPGPMAVASAISCLDRGFQLVPIGFTGNTYHNKDCVITGTYAFHVIVSRGDKFAFLSLSLRRWSHLSPRLLQRIS